MTAALVLYAAIGVFLAGVGAADDRDDRPLSLLGWVLLCAVAWPLVVWWGKWISDAADAATDSDAGRP